MNKTMAIALALIGGLSMSAEAEPIELSDGCLDQVTARTSMTPEARDALERALAESINNSIRKFVPAMMAKDMMVVK